MYIESVLWVQHPALEKCVGGMQRTLKGKYFPLTTSARNMFYKTKTLNRDYIAYEIFQVRIGCLGMLFVGI